MTVIVSIIQLYRLYFQRVVVLLVAVMTLKATDAATMHFRNCTCTPIRIVNSRPVHVIQQCSGISQLNGNYASAYGC